ncbi:MAG: cysteine desulfurase, partial [Burkholderiaceae bacterium]|nr:cysteine desulfurase [Burkholderiaceae bacterium]
MATTFFSALPGESPDFSGPTGAAAPPTDLPRFAQAAHLPQGVQAPVHVAPAGSPLASPAGFGPGVPGTPFPQGQVPGANLLPASPTPLASLAHRAPALAPHASAANGVPDTVVSTLPGYEPRFGSGVLGAPPAFASPFYFVGERHAHPSPGGAAAPAPSAPPDGLDAL